MNIFYFIGWKWKEINPTAVLLVFLTFRLVGIVEYAVSFVYDILWGSIPWDYSNLPLNINGRTSIEHLSAITVFEVVCVYSIQPLLDRILGKIPTWVRYMIGISLIAVIIFDYTITMIY